MTSKWPENLQGSFFGRNKAWEKGWKKWRPEGRNGVAHAARFLGHVGYPIWALVASFASILLPEASSFSRGEHCRNTETTKQRLGLQIEGGKLRRGAVGVVSISPDDISTVSMMKRE